MLIPEPQYAEIIEPLRWIDPRIEMPGVPKGGLDLLKIAGKYGRMSYQKTRPINRRGRRVAYTLETILVIVHYKHVSYVARWEMREKSDKWLRCPSLRYTTHENKGWWEKLTAAQLTQSVKGMVKVVSDGKA